MLYQYEKTFFILRSYLKKEFSSAVFMKKIDPKDITRDMFSTIFIDQFDYADNVILKSRKVTEERTVIWDYTLVKGVMPDPSELE